MTSKELLEQTISCWNTVQYKRGMLQYHVQKIADPFDRNKLDVQVRILHTQEGPLFYQTAPDSPEAEEHCCKAILYNMLLAGTAKVLEIMKDLNAVKPC